MLGQTISYYYDLSLLRLKAASENVRRAPRRRAVGTRSSMHEVGPSGPMLGSNGFIAPSRQLAKQKLRTTSIRRKLVLLLPSSALDSDTYLNRKQVFQISVLSCLSEHTSVVWLE